jgi:hypothetical protein
LSVQNLMKSICTIYRPTETRSSTDSSVADSFAAVASGVLLDFQGDNSREGREYQKDTGRTRFRCYMPRSASVLGGDRLTLTWGYSAGKTVEVISLAFDTAGRGNHQVVIAEDVVTGGA